MASYFSVKTILHLEVGAVTFIRLVHIGSFSLFICKIKDRSGWNYEVFSLIHLLVLLSQLDSILEYRDTLHQKSIDHLPFNKTFAGHLGMLNTVIMVTSWAQSLTKMAGNWTGNCSVMSIRKCYCIPLLWTDLYVTVLEWLWEEMSQYRQEDCPVFAPSFSSWRDEAYKWENNKLIFIKNWDLKETQVVLILLGQVHN